VDLPHSSIPDESAQQHGTRVVGCVLTLNEERTIVDVVRSLSAVAANVVVVDSASTDRTVELATSAGATVIERRFDTFPNQRNWAIDQIVERYDPDWILSLDADEWLSDKLAMEIAQTLGEQEVAWDAFLLPRRVYFSGRLLRWGGFANTRLPRLFRPQAGRYEDRVINEHLALSDGARLGRMQNHILHHDVDSWERYIDKHNRYSTLEAEARLTATGDGRITISQVVRHRHLRRRWLRERLWNRLPGRPLIRFFQMYVLSGGFLDGRAGYRIAVFQAWQELCTDVKYERLLSRRTKASADRPPGPS
jgi:glycosyltransferase involved in cell wall biosynthesis